MATSSSAPSAQLLAVRKSYGAVKALDGVDLDVRPSPTRARCSSSGSSRTRSMRADM